MTVDELKEVVGNEKVYIFLHSDNVSYVVPVMSGRLILMGDRPLGGPFGTVEKFSYLGENRVEWQVEWKAGNICAEIIGGIFTGLLADVLGVMLGIVAWGAFCGVVDWIKDKK
jgi:hypothetical protein